MAVLRVAVGVTETPETVAIAPIQDTSCRQLEAQASALQVDRTQLARERGALLQERSSGLQALKDAALARGSALLQQVPSRKVRLCHALRLPSRLCWYPDLAAACFWCSVNLVVHSQSRHCLQ